MTTKKNAVKQMKFLSLNKFLTETPSNSHTAPEKGPN